MALLFGGHSYRRIIRACTAADPAGRPRDIRALRQRIRRRDRMPYIGAIVAAVLLVASLLIFQFARQRAGLEHQVKERVTSYSEERTDSLEKVRMQRIEALRRGYEQLFEPACRKTLEKIRDQQYREAAQVLTVPYYRETVPCFDSICRRFTVHTDGSVPDELILVGEVFNACRQRIDSTLNRLPSIETLPSSQRDSMLRVIEQMARQVQQDE